ncbi:hypothetical protein G7046_g7075 [Stylonectria norvegica]|nr:hypothetical protein G7046_g7075 [Stylonectria norvegica]
MIETSLWDYVFIRTCIFLLHLVAPLSIVYSIVSSLFHHPLRVPFALEIWLALEAVFYIAIYVPLKAYLQTAATHPATGCREDRWELFWRCHDKIPNPERYLEKWFRDAPPEEIKRENVKDFFRWAFLNTADMDPEYDEELEEYTNEMEKILGRKLEPGRGSAKCLRLTIDKVEMLHRSLTWYFCVSVVDTITSVYLRFYSFDFYRAPIQRFLAVFPFRPLTLFTSYRSASQTLTYWHRQHTSKTRLPVLFLHGIGVGLYPYVDFLADLNTPGSADPEDGQVGIIAIEIMSISSRITAEAMLKEEMCEEVTRIIRTHGWEKFVLVTHSYGSVVAAHLLHKPQMAAMIGPILFVDPVSFLLHLPDVAYNFICRKPKGPHQYQLSYFGSKDIGVSHTLFRRFFWADNVLWKEDLKGHKVTVVLAGQDGIVDTPVIGAYLTGAEDWVFQPEKWENGLWKGDGLDVLWFQDLHHGCIGIDGNDTDAA